MTRNAESSGSLAVAGGGSGLYLSCFFVEEETGEGLGELEAGLMIPVPRGAINFS